MPRPWRRRRNEPDKRLDWRDPNMPVLRPWEFPDGSKGLAEIPPQEESRHCHHQVNNGNPLAPEWFNDETYNLARRKRKRRL